MARQKELYGAGLELRMLGPLAVLQRGCAVELPASRKARALLAYLALAPCATPRSRLCELLLDTVSDSRGDLRWYLSKLRGIVGPKWVLNDEDSVRIDAADCFIDALEVQRAARKGFAALTPEQAQKLLTLFNGNFLEGLELDRCPSFTGWLLAQRRHFHGWRVALLHRLVESAPGAEFFGHVEKWVEVAPFDVRAHEHLMRELVRRDRFHEAKEHLATSMKLFAAEGMDSAPLGRAWREAKAERAAPPAPRFSDRQYD